MFEIGRFFGKGKLESGIHLLIQKQASSPEKEDLRTLNKAISR